MKKLYSNFIFLFLFGFLSVALTAQDVYLMPTNGTQNLSFCEGTLQDPGGDNIYNSNMNSSVLISSGDNKNPIITFTEFNFENNFDYLYIYDGTNDGGILLGEFTGNLTNDLPFDGLPVLSLTGSFFIRATSDGSVQADGFTAQIGCYSIEQAPIVDFTPNYHPVLTNFITCDGTVAFGEQVFLSPTSWAWEFGDGNTSTQQNPVHTYSQQGTYTVSLTACNDFGCTTVTKENLVLFDAQNATCFEYNMPITGEQILVACQGTLFDSNAGFEGNYTENDEGITIIQPGQGTIINFTFAEFDLYPFANDHVQVYDGVFPNATLIGDFYSSFDSDTLPNNGLPLTATSGAISVVFITDEFFTFPGNGFTAYWNVINDIELPIAAFEIEDTSVPFNTPIKINDLSQNNPGQWTWTFSNGVVLNEQNPEIVFTQAGEYSVTLTVSNCEGESTTQAQTFTVLSPPQLVQNNNPDYDVTFCTGNAPYNFLLESGQDTSLTFGIGNFPLVGLGELAYEVIGLSNAIAGISQVLIYDWGIQDQTTFTEPYNQILASVPNVNIYTTNTQNPATLELELESKQVFLVLAHQDDLDEDRFSDFQEVLDRYVNNGGTVVFLGQSNSNETNDPDIIFNSGLIDGEYLGDDFNGPTVYVNSELQHPITTDLPPNFKGQTSTTRYQITNPDAQTLVSYQGYDMVSVRENIGTSGGKVVFVGFNYAYANDAMRQMLTNIVKWGSNVTNVQWLSVTPQVGTVNAGSFQDIDVSINTQGVPDGTYTFFLTIATNDIDNPICITPITITVTGRPEIEVSTDTLNFGEVIQFTEESLILTIFNTGQDTLVIDDIIFDYPNFTISDTDFIVFPGLSQSIVVTYAPLDIELLEGLVMTIFSNDLSNPTTEIIINAEGIGAPLISPNPSPIEITVNADEQGTATLDINNIGLSNLEFCVETLINSGAGYLLTFTTDFFPTEFYWNITDEDGEIVAEVEPGTYTQSFTTYEVLISEGLNPEATYTLNFFDVNNDGAFSAPYTVTDVASGNLIATGEFTFAQGGETSANLTGFTTWFGIEGNECDISAYPDGSTTYQLLFDATGLIGGEYSASVLITSNDPTAPTIEVPVIMTVVGIPQIEVEAAQTLDFGSVIIGNTSSQTITITNTGTDVLLVNDFISTFGDAFQIEPNSFYELAVGESVTVTIIFTPTQILDYSGTLEIINNDQNITLNIIADGQGAPAASIDTNEITTILQAGDCETFEINLSNNGQGPLEYNITSGIQGDFVGFEFAFTLDFFPLEFYWELLDADGNIVQSVPPGTYSGFTEATETFTGLSGTQNYTLRLLDTFGDGALDDYTITDLWSGNLIVQDGFPAGDEQLVDLGVPASPQVITVTPTNGILDFPDQQTLSIELCANGLTADSYPVEIVIATNEPNNSPIIIPITMNVIAFPQAIFDADNDDLVCGQGVEVQFTDESVNTPTSWLWDFGDGNTSTQENPTHIYELSGSFDVTLYVSNELGADTTTYTNFIEVDLNCLDETIPANNTQTLVGCNGTISDSGGDIFYVNNSQGIITLYAPGASSITLTFDFFAYDVFDTLYVFDGPDINSTLFGAYNNANPISVGQSFSSSGEYLTLYEVTDAITGAGFGGFVATFECEEPALPPLANFTFEQISSCGGDVKFTSTAQNFPNTWFWNFGDGNTSYQTNPTHTFSQNGVYQVSLTVLNNFGSDNIIITVPVTVLDVDVEIPSEVAAGVPVQFVGNNTGVIWEWNFGEGSSSTAKNPIFTYQNVGVYEITVTITDFGVAADCVNTLTQTITVVEEPDNIQQIGNAYWNVFPNPANDELINLVIQDLNSNNLLIELTDISGRTIWQTQTAITSYFTMQIPLGNLASGMYMVRLSDAAHFSSQMIVKK